ncbi:MAG: cupin domain-containing protein [Candidatus Bathyarchaeia archaeon]
MILVRFDEPQEYHAPGQETRRARVFIDEEKIGRKDVAVGMSIYGPGMAAPFHAHKGSETMFIVHGRGQFGTREEVVEVGPGDVLYFAPGEEHFLKNTGSQTLEFLFIYSQPGDEKPIKEKWVPLVK